MRNGKSIYSISPSVPLRNKNVIDKDHGILCKWVYWMKSRLCLLTTMCFFPGSGTKWLTLYYTTDALVDNCCYYIFDLYDTFWVLCNFQSFVPILLSACWFAELWFEANRWEHNCSFCNSLRNLCQERFILILLRKGIFPFLLKYPQLLLSVPVFIGGELFILLKTLHVSFKASVHCHYMLK